MSQKHDCFFAHTDPKDLKCNQCPKKKGCTFNKNFPMHDCYYPEKGICKNCWHRFYCTFTVVLPPPQPFKYVYQHGEIVKRNPDFKNTKGKCRNPS